MPDALPPGIHVTTLTGTDPNGQPITYTVVWADRPYRACPRCGEPVDMVVENCPAALNERARSGGQLDPWQDQHGCGKWIGAQWFSVGRNETIASVAAVLAKVRNRDIETMRTAIRDRLLEDLTEFLARIDQGEDVGDGTGSETEPGIYHDGTVWIAWDQDPVDETATIAVDDLDIRDDEIRAVPRQHTVTILVQVVGPDPVDLARIADAVYQALTLPETVTTVDGDTYKVTGKGFPLDQNDPQQA